MHTHCRTRFRSEAGLTIVELLAAVLVLSIGVLGLAPLMALSVRGSVRGENVTNVVAAAQQMIEKKIGAVGFPTMPYTHTDTFEDGKYAAITTVTDRTVDSSIPDHVYRVNVEVMWTDDTGLERHMHFTTFTTKN
jgi:Tfp pilus assembly protein PilV